jgi:membrane peptidoglycan carboxypeptidase
VKIDYPRSAFDGPRRFLPSWRQTAALGGGFFGLLVLLFVVAYVRTDLNVLNEVATNQTTVIRFANGNEIGRLGAQNRITVPLKQVPPDVQHAVLAAEDRNFYSESGISPRGIARALWADLRGGEVQGGSTITQQYAKNAYLTQERTLSRKLKEIVIAVKLNNEKSKSQILESYLNTIYFGRQAYGIQTASQTYFSKDVSQLTPAEGALIAAIIRSPAGYDPKNHPDRAKARWEYVVNGMVKKGWLTEAQRDSMTFPQVHIRNRTLATGARGYIMQAVQNELARRKITEAQINLGGLTIVTTLDYKAQVAAEKAVAEVFPKSPDDVHTSLTAVEPGTGKIRAMFGGRDYGKRQLNDATQANRQPGSSFKPFVLVTALKDGISLKSRYDGHSPKDFPGRDPVHNFGPGKGEQFGMIDLVTATAHSVNTVYYQLGLDAGGPSKVIDTAKAAGITNDIDPAKAATNVFLGSGDTVETNSLQMADAYATFAAEGKHATPYLVSVVREGKRVLYKAKDDTDQAFDKDVIADATYAMEHVLTEGTARSAQLDGGRPAAGKTGTVQENTDAWFCGYVPQLAASVHIYREGSKPLRNLGGYNEVTGGTLPAKIWKAFMDAALQGEPVKDFPPPAYVGDSKNPAPATPSAPGSTTPTPIATLPTAVPTQQPPTLPPIKPTKGGGGGSPTPQPTGTAAPQPSTSP